MISNHDVDKALARLLDFVEAFDPEQMTAEEKNDVAEARAAVMLLGTAWRERVKEEADLRGRHEAVMAQRGAW